MPEQRRIPRRVEVLGRERLVDAIYKVDRIRLRYEYYDGEMSKPVSRILFERGDSVAVLPYDPETRRVLLICQFRYPAYVRDEPAGAGLAAGGDRADAPGWLWEIIAGTQDGEAEEVARREAQEEAGLQLGDLERLATVFPSPGACSERVTIFLAAVHLEGNHAAHAGLRNEAEDTLVRSVSLDRALEMVRTGEIVDAKTVLALQYLLLRLRDGRLPGGGSAGAE